MSSMASNLSKLEKSLYRTCVRFSRGCTKTEKPLLLQPRLDPATESNWRYYDVSANNRKIVKSLFAPWPGGMCDDLLSDLLGSTNISTTGRWVDGATLLRLFRKAFRLNLNSQEERNECIDFGIRVIRELHLLRKLTEQSSRVYDADNKVTVTCTSTFSEELTHENLKHYIHHYRITIENAGEEKVQLLNRSWTFKGDDGAPPTILPKWQSGVVGEKPNLLHGEGFQYMSRTKIGAKTGHMEGVFQFSDSQWGLFEVEVGRCPLTGVKFD